MPSQGLLSNLTMTVQSVLLYICRIGGPFLIFIGTIDCILNLIVFTQKTLRKNPCSIYFISYNVANFLYIYFTLLYITVSIGYNIDPSTYNLVFCRSRLYTALLFHCLSQFYLSLASFDRILITSRNALTRRRSTHRLAYVSIITGTIFWALFHSHVLIFSNIIQLVPNYFVCYFQQSIEAVFINYYTLIKETVLLSLMIISGLWSINNIRRVGRVRVVLNQSTQERNVEEGSLPSTKDRQFLMMLIMDIIIYALFSFVLAIFLLYEEITKNDLKGSDQVQLENHMRNLCLFGLTIPSCMSFYANLWVSKTFRKELKKVLL